MKGKIKYRIERWVDYKIPDWNSWIHREHHFDSWDEVEKYIQAFNPTYRLKIFKYVEELVQELPATHDVEQMTSEEMKELMKFWETKID